VVGASGVKSDKQNVGVARLEAGLFRRMAASAEEYQKSRHSRQAQGGSSIGQRLGPLPTHNRPP